MTGSHPLPHATLLDGLAAPDLDFDLDFPAAWAALRMVVGRPGRSATGGPSR